MNRLSTDRAYILQQHLGPNGVWPQADPEYPFSAQRLPHLGRLGFELPQAQAPAAGSTILHW